MMNRIIPQTISKPNTGKKKPETAPMIIPTEWIIPWSVINKQNSAKIPVRDKENLSQIISAASLTIEKRMLISKQAIPMSAEQSNHLNEVQVLI